MLRLIIGMSGKFSSAYLLTQPPTLEKNIVGISRATINTSHSPAQKTSRYGACQYPKVSWNFKSFSGPDYILLFSSVPLGTPEKLLETLI